MKTISYREKDFDKKIKGISNRKAFTKKIEEEASIILKDVKERGNAALSEYALKFDKLNIEPENFQVTAEKIAEAKKNVSPPRKFAIEEAIRYITSFALKQKPKNWNYSPRNGVTLGERFNPLTRVGAYIPGGTAPLVSTAIHTIAIAKAAGVREIVATTPAGKNGKIASDLIFAMKAAGATEIYKLGGIYGIGALAYGTETINKVEKIVGPGNAYVTAAKKITYGDVSIDMIAGPSEVMVIADALANPDFVAADLLSQAEHGSGMEHAILLTPSALFIEKVKISIETQLKKLKRTTAIKKVLSEGVFLLELENIAQAINIANEYAPEHLEIMCADNEYISEQITAAGAIFLGEYTPEPVGDFIAGPSHVLPTGGSAKLFSGITIDTFMRRSSLIKYTKQALEKEVYLIERFAEMEGLDAHSNSALIRFNDYLEVSQK